MYESLEDTGLNDGVRRGQKEGIKQSKTQESFWGITDKQDRRRKGNGMLIWSEASMECLLYLGTEAVTTGGLRSNLFLFPLLGAGGGAIWDSVLWAVGY